MSFDSLGGIFEYINLGECSAIQLPFWKHTHATEGGKIQKFKNLKFKIQNSKI